MRRQETVWTGATVPKGAVHAEDGDDPPQVVACGVRSSTRP
jgi:hypothetical protein